MRLGEIVLAARATTAVHVPSQRNVALVAVLNKTSHIRKEVRVNDRVARGIMEGSVNSASTSLPATTQLELGRATGVMSCNGMGEKKLLTRQSLRLNIPDLRGTSTCHLLANALD